MESLSRQQFSFKGKLTREKPEGLQAGAPLTQIRGPKEALGRVATELTEAEAELATLLVSDVAEIEQIASYLAAAGGKRLRPALTALGARAVGVTGSIGRLMCVGELIHLGSLLHDDVVDGAETRRGQRAAHHHFGNAASILSGDFCLARAMLLASEEGGPEAAHSLAQVVTDMAEGEVMQLRWAGDLDCTIETYLKLIDKKSAALISWCVAAGARKSGDAEMSGRLVEFGRHLGIAFQITDDVLDYRTGTGKVPGADLRERKVTLPLLYAMEKEPSIRRVLQEGSPSPALVERLMVQVQESGGLNRALEYARARIEHALIDLACVPEGPDRRALEVLANYIVERSV